MSVPCHCPSLHLAHTPQKIFQILKWKKINWNSVPELKIYDSSLSTYKLIFHVKINSFTYFVTLLLYGTARLRFPSSDDNVMLWVSWFVTSLEKCSFWLQSNDDSRHSQHIYRTQPSSISYSDQQLQNINKPMWMHVENITISVMLSNFWKRSCQNSGSWNGANSSGSTNKMQMSTSVQLLKKKFEDKVFWACNAVHFSLQLLFKEFFTKTNI